MIRVFVKSRFKLGSPGGVSKLLATLTDSSKHDCDIRFYITEPEPRHFSASSIVNIYPLHRILVFINDIITSSKMACEINVDAVMYVGSIPHLSAVIAKLCSKPIILYVNGYVHHELINKVYASSKSRMNLKEILKFIWAETLWGVGIFLVDIYVFPCYATYEYSKIPRSKRYRVLPLWLSDLETRKIISGHDIFSKEKGNKDLRHVINRDKITIITYTSNVYSPKILDSKHLIKLGQLVRNMSKREFDFLIIDPKSKPQRVSSNIEIIGRLSREEYFELLTKSILYIESVIDDELRYSTLEAMLLGVPVAKLTHPRYWDKLDFKYELFSSSVPEFIEKIAWYVDHVEELYSKYSFMVREYVLRKRTWNNVKQLFLEILNLGDRH